MMSPARMNSFTSVDQLLEPRLGEIARRNRGGRRLDQWRRRQLARAAQDVVKLGQLGGGGGVGPIDLGRGAAAQPGVDAKAEGLLDAVEDDQRVRHHEIGQRQLELVAGRGRDRGLDPGDVLIADVTDRTAGEARHPRQLDRFVAGQLLFDQAERVGRGGDNLRLLARPADFRGFRTGGDDEPGAEAQEAVAVEVLAAFDRFEQIGGALILELGIDRDRSLEIRHQVDVDRNDVSLPRQGGEFGFMRVDVHGRKPA